jgi:hypothetical protein
MWEGWPFEAKTDLILDRLLAIPFGFQRNGFLTC